jgi:hypothetical protein
MDTVPVLARSNDTVLAVPVPQHWCRKIQHASWKLNPLNIKIASFLEGPATYSLFCVSELSLCWIWQSFVVLRRKRFDWQVFLFSTSNIWIASSLKAAGPAIFSMCLYVSGVGSDENGYNKNNTFCLEGFIRYRTASKWAQFLWRIM